MNITLLNHTPAPERTVATAARVCYSGNDIETVIQRCEDADQTEFLRKVLGSGHLSVLEHASFTFGIEGISRATSHQLVRHRIASYSQQSQRYVVEQTFDFIMPQSISILTEMNSRYKDLMAEIDDFYADMLKEGVPPEDARFVLPNAAETKLVMTMNGRELRHFFALRCCDRAQWEIRAMADAMLGAVKEVAPVLFENAGAACVSGPCPEGAMSCGKPKG